MLKQVSTCKQVSNYVSFLSRLFFTTSIVLAIRRNSFSWNFPVTSLVALMIPKGQNVPAGALRRFTNEKHIFCEGIQNSHAIFIIPDLFTVTHGIIKILFRRFSPMLLHLAICLLALAILFISSYCLGHCFFSPCYGSSGNWNCGNELFLIVFTAHVTKLLRKQNRIFGAS